MNLPTRAEDAHATLAAAYNTGDVATVMNMYDVSGIIVPEPGKPVSGRQHLHRSHAASVRRHMEDRDRSGLRRYLKKPSSHPKPLLATGGRLFASRPYLAF